MSDGRENPLDGKWEIGLSFCGQIIKRWRSHYMRKTSRRKVIIQCRCWHPDTHPQSWRYFLELIIEDKQKEQHRIREEAYDSLIADPKLERHHYTGIDFTVLQTF